MIVTSLYDNHPIHLVSRHISAHPCAIYTQIFPRKILYPLRKNSIIEVKSGKVRHKTKQFLEQQDLAREHNKSHIVYAPDITDKKFNELKSKGITVVRNKNDLLERNKK